MRRLSRSMKTTCLKSKKYMISWQEALQNLSYTECTWEKSSLIRKQDETEAKIKDFERFNRSLDNNSRQKMMGFGYAHK